MAKRDRYTIFTDGLTLTHRFSRRYAVILEKYVPLLEHPTSRLSIAEIIDSAFQTDCPRRAREYCDEMNGA